MPELKDQILDVLTKNPQLIEAAMRVAKPVMLPTAEVMLYAIDPDRNQSKFYEMEVVAGPVPQDGKGAIKDHRRNKAANGYILMRRWGRLTDKGGVTGRVDALNDLFDDEGTAVRAMTGIQSEKMSGRGSAVYTDVSHTRSYPIGLGGAGFGWGGQAVCRLIPELRELKSHIDSALAMLKPLSRTDSEVALELGKMLTPAQRYLEQQLSECRG